MSEPLSAAARTFAAHVSSIACDHAGAAGGTHTGCPERLALDEALAASERPPVDPLRERIIAALEELPRQTVHADPFFPNTTYEYETVGLAVALATVEAVCASFGLSSETGSSGSGSTSASGGPSGSPSPASDGSASPVDPGPVVGGVPAGASFPRPPVDPVREAALALFDAMRPPDPITPEYMALYSRFLTSAVPAAPRPEGEWAAFMAWAEHRDASPAAPVATLHTCWDNHEGPDGTHADGSPCRDKATPLFASPAARCTCGAGGDGGRHHNPTCAEWSAASPAVPRPEGLDAVIRAAWPRSKDGSGRLIACWTPDELLARLSATSEENR